METEVKSEVSTETQKGASTEPQKKSPGRPAKKPKQKKVIEVKTETAKDQIPKQKVNRNLHEVIVDGKSRSMTKFSYEAIVKDPNRTVELPSGSRLVEPKNEPCKDC